MPFNDFINMTQDEFNKWFRAEAVAHKPDLEFMRLCNEYFRNIGDDFEAEWSQKKFKWFFKKRRQNKLMTKIYHRYRSPLYYLIEKTIEETLPDMASTTEFFDKFVDVKNLEQGETNHGSN